MSRLLLDLPDEILLQILKHVMFSDLPVDLSFLLDRLRQRAFSSSCFSLFEGRQTCSCSLHAEPQIEHLRDWAIATGSSRRFRALAMETFHSEKSFVLEPPLLKRLSQRTVLFVTPLNADLFFKHARQIIVPLPACSAASAFLTLPRYQKFDRLELLVLWPGTNPGERFPDLHQGKLRQDLAPKDLTDLLYGIGLSREGVRLDVIRSVRENDWCDQMSQLRQVVFPYLRFVGTQKAVQTRRN